MHCESCRNTQTDDRVVSLMSPTSAVMFDRFGDVRGLALRRVDPVPLQEGQVRIAVRIAGLNPVDWQIVESEELGSAFGLSAPAGFGNDFAGVITEIGARVDRWQVGDRVFGGARGAAVATSLVLDADHRSLHATPTTVTDEAVGVLDIAGRTASAVYDALNVQAGETVLIGAAGGGVGSILTQLLVQAGATVIGTGSAASADFISSLGAEPVKYGPGLAESVRAAAHGPIAAAADLHGVAAARAALDLGVHAERIVTIESDAPPAGVLSVNGSDAKRDALARLVALIGSGALVVPIAAIYPLEDFRDAIDHQRSRHVHGKIAIRPESRA